MDTFKETVTVKMRHSVATGQRKEFKAVCYVAVVTFGVRLHRIMRSALYKYRDFVCATELWGIKLYCLTEVLRETLLVSVCPPQTLAYVYNINTL